MHACFLMAICIVGHLRLLNVEFGGEFFMIYAVTKLA